MKVWRVEIDDGEDRYVAFGLDDSDMPLYRVDEMGLNRTTSRYPTCMKFMTGDARGPDLVEEKTITDRFGEVVWAP